MAVVSPENVERFEAIMKKMGRGVLLLGRGDRYRSPNH